MLMLSVLLGVASNPLGDTEAMHAATRRENVLLAPIDCTTVITSLCDPASSGPGNCLALWVICWLYYRVWLRKRLRTRAFERKERRARSVYMYPSVPEVLFLVVGLQLCMMCADMYMKCVVNLATQSARRIAQKPNYGTPICQLSLHN